MNVPVIETRRLILRGFRPSDERAMVASMQNEGFARFLTPDGRAQSANEAWRGAASVAGSWALRGYSMFAVEEKASGDLVGRVGPWEPAEWPDMEIGWGIFPSGQGKGYAVEAAAAAFVWAHGALGRDHVIHLINPQNEPSRRVAERLGGKLTGSWDALWGDTIDVWTTRWADFAETKAGKAALRDA